MRFHFLVVADFVDPHFNCYQIIVTVFISLFSLSLMFSSAAFVPSLGEIVKSFTLETRMNGTRVFSILLLSDWLVRDVPTQRIRGVYPNISVTLCYSWRERPCSFFFFPSSLLHHSSKLILFIYTLVFWIFRDC